MYAIVFDLKQDMLSKAKELERVLAQRGFTRSYKSVYFGDPQKVDAVKCVLAVQDLTKQFPWFAASIEDIRMLRIEDNNDLMPAINMVAH